MFEISPNFTRKLLTQNEYDDFKKIYIYRCRIFLSGCPGPGDRMVSRESITTRIQDNHVCIVSPLKPTEKVTAIQINSDKSGALHKVFDATPFYVAQGRCLPLFGFTFIPGERYFVAYDVISEQENSHLITAEFSLAMDPAGNMKIF